MFCTKRMVITFGVDSRFQPQIAQSQSILDLPLIYINGGRRGFLVGVHPHDLMRALSPTVVEVALKA